MKNTYIYKLWRRILHIFRIHEYVVKEETMITLRYGPNTVGPIKTTRIYQCKQCGMVKAVYCSEQTGCRTFKYRPHEFIFGGGKALENDM